MVQENLTPQSLLADQLVAFCRGAFPCRNKLAISNLAQINGGWECEIYSFVLESGEKEERKQEDLILRLFEGSEAASKAKSEFRVMRQLRQIDYPVPWVLVLADKNSPFGKPFVIYGENRGAGAELDGLPTFRRTGAASTSFVLQAARRSAPA